MTVRDLVDVSVKMFGNQYAIHIDLDSSMENKIVKGDFLMHLFRIIQEVFQNILRHAEATEVWVKIYKTRKNHTLAQPPN